MRSLGAREACLREAGRRGARCVWTEGRPVLEKRLTEWCRRRRPSPRGPAPGSPRPLLGQVSWRDSPRPLPGPLRRGARGLLPSPPCPWSPAPRAGLETSQVLARRPLPQATSRSLSSFMREAGVHSFIGLNSHIRFTTSHLAACASVSFTGRGLGRQPHRLVLERLPPPQKALSWLSARPPWLRLSPGRP